MIFISRATLHANALKALQERRLQIFAPNLANGEPCMYLTDEGFVCAIGASLNPETARAFDTHKTPQGLSISSISRLALDKQFETDDLPFAELLQAEHDSLVGAIGTGALAQEQAAANFARFLRETESQA